MDNNRLLLALEEKTKMVNEALEKMLPREEAYPTVIHKAMRYSLMAGGKRLRPFLVMASAEAVGGRGEDYLPAACALELIHTYSLIHDDLPALDDDELRRGRPTNHKVFGDAMAILAGDALLTEAFVLLVKNGGTGNANTGNANTGNGITPNSVDPAKILQVIGEIADAAGSRGMIGGQVVDLESEQKMIDAVTMEYIHQHKTGALFRASVRTGALLAGAGKKEIQHLTEYAEKFGLAFQITDDILDVEGDTAKLGKPAGSDEKKQKSTYPSLFGLAKAKEMARQAVEDAEKALGVFGEKAELLKLLARYLLDREN